MSRYSWKANPAIVSKVTINVPGFAEIVGSFDQHGSRPKRLKDYDGMSDVKFRLQVQGNGYVLLAVFSLPPGALVTTEGLQKFSNV